MTELTPMEMSIYKYIADTIENEGYAPSVRDICQALGIRSTSTVHSYLGSLTGRAISARIRTRAAP